MNPDLNNIKKLWYDNRERYLKFERGSDGNEGFCRYFLVELLELSESNNHGNVLGTFKNQKGTGVKNRTADFVIYPSANVIIPIEVEKLENIKAGEMQLLNYQSDLDTKYGILTDCKEWRFFYGTKAICFDIEKDIFGNLDSFLVFWNDYINASSFYVNYFEDGGHEALFENYKPKVDTNREKYFDRTTNLVAEFKTKLIQKGFMPKEGGNKDKKATELAYSYLISTIWLNPPYSYGKHFDQS
jgi:hypothetical protein